MPLSCQGCVPSPKKKSSASAPSRGSGSSALAASARRRSSRLPPTESRLRAGHSCSPAPRQLELDGSLVRARAAVLESVQLRLDLRRIARRTDRVSEVGVEPLLDVGLERLPLALLRPNAFAV